MAIKQFCHFVEGRQFSITTDHKPQTFGLFTNSSKLTPHQIQHLDYIAQLTTDIIYTKRSNNLVANALPGIKANALHSNSFVDLQERAVAQETEPDLFNFQITMSSLKLKVYYYLPLMAQYCVRHPQKNPDHMYLNNSVTRYLITYIHSRIPA